MTSSFKTVLPVALAIFKLERAVPAPEPTACLKVTAPVPALTVKPYVPSTVEVNVTASLVVFKTVSAPKVTAPV